MTGIFTRPSLFTPRWGQLSRTRSRQSLHCVAQASDQSGGDAQQAAGVAPAPTSSTPELYGSFVKRRLQPTSLTDDYLDTLYQRLDPCRRCAGSGRVACPTCAGSGRLSRGGYHKRNPVNLARIQGSKWTAMQRTLGWRHFRCTQLRKEQGQAFALLAATCDESTQVWVNTKSLKDRQLWAAGWLQKHELQALEQQQEAERLRAEGQVQPNVASSLGSVSGGETEDKEEGQAAGGRARRKKGKGKASVGAAVGTECKGCSGGGLVACPLCSKGGQVIEL